MRQIPTITKNLLIINIIAYLANVILAQRGIDVNGMLGLHFFMASDFHLYQIITYMFMHGGWTHLFFNMFALWMFGCTLERAWGEKKFLWFTLACGVGAGLFQEIAQFVEYAVQGLAAYDSVNANGMVMPMASYLNMWNTVGFSGAVYGILLGFGMTYPEERIFIFPLPVPIKGKWFVCIYAVIELGSALTMPGDGVAHIAHLGGMVIGYLIILYWRHQYGGGSSFSGWDGYEVGTRACVFTRIKEWFRKKMTPRNSDGWHYNKNANSNTRQQSSDSDERRKTQEEIDRILEKIKRSGYDSLSADERRKLFDRK